MRSLARLVRLDDYQTQSSLRTFDTKKAEHAVPEGYQLAETVTYYVLPASQPVGSGSVCGCVRDDLPVVELLAVFLWFSGRSTTFCGKWLGPMVLPNSTHRPCWHGSRPFQLGRSRRLHATRKHFRSRKGAMQPERQSNASMDLDPECRRENERKEAVDPFPPATHRFDPCAR